MINENNPVLRLIFFFWAVSWRTLIIAMITAIFVGIGLGYLQVNRGMPSEIREHLTALSGIPVTIMTLIYVFIRQGMRFREGAV